jgi:MYXO-CTERM domain-containing protein
MRSTVAKARIAARVTLALLGACGAARSERAASAAPLVTTDAALDAKANGYERQADAFSTLESGLFLDCNVKAADVALVKSYFAQTQQQSFLAFAGRHPFDVIAQYGEYGDMGNFAGIGSVAAAAKLMLLRAAGAPAADVQKARDAAVRAARTWHVYGAIAGAGFVARGVRRVRSENATDPPLPGTLPELVPLKDGSGAPLPASKDAVWRAPVAPGFADWIFFDNTSKDQVSGYALGVLWLWDALHDDPAAPKDASDAIAADLAAFAKSLMTVSPETGIDLCIREADGRLSKNYDLNPRVLLPGNPPLPEDSALKNGFNAAMALGVVRAAYHVSGDAEIGRYYYEELVGRRDLPRDMASNAGGAFVGAGTNFSNVNMLALSLALLGRTETDPYVRAKLDETLAKQFWSTGDTRDVSHTKQAWFDAVYASYATGASPVGDRIHENLLGFQDAPAFERDRTNCDDAEIASGTCLAVDGTTTLKLMKDRGWGGGVVADAVVPMSVRPDSDFQWRSDPFAVNGKGDPTLMDPGGDFLAAYWLARLSDTDPTKNLSPSSRPALPYVHADADADGGAPHAPPPASSGCSCHAGAATTSGFFGLLALAGAALVIARRARATSGSASCRRSPRSS